MEGKMSRWGVGPIFAFLSIGYAMIMLAINRYFQPHFQIDFVPYWLISIFGISLVVIGVPFFIISVKQLCVHTMLMSSSLMGLSDVAAIRFMRHGWFLLSRAWHQIEATFRWRPFQSARSRVSSTLSGSLFFIPPPLVEGMIWTALISGTNRWISWC